MGAPVSLSTLQQRIDEMQSLRLQSRSLPTAPYLAPLLPGGALQAGSTYAVRGSWQLALSFLAEASRRGAWCGVLGCDSFGAEAAAALGIALDRCVLVPAPGEHALSLIASLSESLEVVVARVDHRVASAQVERLSARLRDSGTALVVLGDWARSESRLTVIESSWNGLGEGAGTLQQHELLVRSEDRRGTRQHRVQWAASGAELTGTVIGVGQRTARITNQPTAGESPAAQPRPKHTPAAHLQVV